MRGPRDDWPGGSPPDDVDRLFARLEPVAPPPDLSARILAQTIRRAPARWTLWATLAILTGGVAAGLAAVLGYLTGQELVQSGGFELLRLGLEDTELLATEPDYLQAVAAAVPWGGLLGMIACIGAAYAATRPLARAAALLDAPRRRPA